MLIAVLLTVASFEKLTQKPNFASEFMGQIFGGNKNDLLFPTSQEHHWTIEGRVATETPTLNIKELSIHKFFPYPRTPKQIVEINYFNPHLTVGFSKQIVMDKVYV